MVDLAETIFRDFVTDGVASSGTHKPEKSRIREWGTWLEGMITAFVSDGGQIYDTRANLFADLAQPANRSAWVVADPTVGFNGIYRKIGAPGAGSWTRVADLPYSFIRLNDAGAGTANAIVATSSIPLPAATSAALLVMNVFEANTDPAVTISVNGTPAKPLKTMSGNDMAPGYLVAGMRVAFVDEGTSFRLLSDVASAAIAVAADAARVAAEAARDAAIAAAAALAPNIFATVAAASAYSPVFAPTFVQTAFYDTNQAKTSGGLYKKALAEPSHTGKFSMTLAGATVVWFELDESEPSISMFGARPGAAAAVNRVAAQNAVAYCQAKGLRVLRVDGGAYDLTGIDQTIHGVILIGDGQVTGVYRKRVFKGNRSRWQPGETLVPEKHMRRTLKAGAITAVIVGDSISTPFVAGQGDKSNPVDGMAERLQHMFVRAFSPKPVTWYNRAIGGQRFFDLDGVVSAGGQALVDWYTNPAQAWLDYIKDLQPDVVFVSFGMNDGDGWNAGNFPTANFYSVFNKMRGWAKVPDIVFCTNLVPSIYTTDDRFSPEAKQEGRDAVAGFVRTFCDSAGIGYIDFNRHNSVVRDGYDPVDTSMTVYAEAVVQAIPYLPTVKCRNYVLRGKFSAITADFWNVGGGAGTPFTFSLSPTHATSMSDAIILQNVGGFLRVDVHRANQIVYSATTTVAAPATGADVEILVAVVNSHARLSINGIVLFDAPVVRHGGSFSPRFMYGANQPGMNGTFKLLVGAEAEHIPDATDVEIFGIGGLNHPTAEGTQRLFAPLINRQRFHGHVPRVEAAGEVASRLLPWAEGIAIDFRAKDHCIRDLTTPANDAQGDATSLITMHSGAATYAVDATTKERMGIRLTGSVVGYIPLAGKPFSATAGTVLMEAMVEDANQGITIVLGRDDTSAPRMQFGFNAAGAPTVSVINDAGTTVAPMASAAASAIGRFCRMGFSWTANRFNLMVNGIALGQDFSGDLPTGLTRIKLGQFNNTSQIASSSTVIRKLAIVPTEMPLEQLVRWTL